MNIQELVRDVSTLENIADLLLKELKKYREENVISRYIRGLYDSAYFINGEEFEVRFFMSNLSKEMMERGIYTQTMVEDLFPHNVNEVSVARDLQEHRFHFYPKGIPLPKENQSFVEKIPLGFDMYDEELREFSKNHKNTKLARDLFIKQQIIVNSKGGKFIQTIPCIQISYDHGFDPIPTNRIIGAVCTSGDDIRGLTKLIKYLADPTSDKRIKKAKTLTDAFHELYKISSLKFGSLTDAGIPLSELYDVVVLTGTPAHEIFGHQFEEPIRFLSFGEVGTFKYGQNIQNKDIVLMDNPKQEIENLRVLGFTHVDAYGRKREQRVHIKDGKVLGFLGGEYADPEKLEKYMNLKESHFIGNSSQDLQGWFPQPRMSCTVLDGKTEDIDLEGKILIVSHEGSTQPEDKTYKVEAKECYVIKNGEPRRLIPLQVTGGINQALANIVLLNDLNYNCGICKSPEPIYYPQSHGRAEISVSTFARTQMWKEQQVYPLPISDIHLKIL
jgi:hypothetical protein